MMCYDVLYCSVAVIETLYRLTLTGLLVLVAQGSSLQIVVGFCFAVFFFLCYQHFTPFHDPILQQLQHISLFQVASIFFIALTIKADFVDKNNLMVNILIVVAIFLNFIIDLISFIWKKYLYSLFFTPLDIRDTSLGDNSIVLEGDSEELGLEQGRYKSNSNGSVSIGNGNGVVMSALHSRTRQEGGMEKNEKEDDFLPESESERGSSFIEMSSPRALSVIRSDK